MNIGTAPSLPRAGYKSGLNSSKLVRLLAELGSGDNAVAAHSKQTFAEKLSRWLDWPDAILLAAALNRENNAGSSVVQPTTSAAAPLPFGEYVRVRAELTNAIVSDVLFAAGKGVLKRRQAAPETVIDAVPEASTYRRAYLVQQRAMAAALTLLRGQVRARLCSHSAALSQLAALDAALDEALGERERHLFSKLPTLLESHFERLRRASLAPAADHQAARFEDTPAQPAAWLVEYCKDMQAVLLAELEIRLQPIEGMMAAMGDVVGDVVGSEVGSEDGFEVGNRVTRQHE